jgi:hypothetical protein
MSLCDELLQKAREAALRDHTYSEDFGHARSIAGRRACNPFLQARGGQT